MAMTRETPFDAGIEDECQRQQPGPRERRSGGRAPFATQAEAVDSNSRDEDQPESPRQPIAFEKEQYADRDEAQGHRRPKTGRRR